jgi:UMF1 family MFS transporter
MSGTPYRKNDRKIIFGWCMYDWANSAFATTILAALLPAYFAGEVVGPDGVIIAGTLYSATALWGFIIALAAFLIFISAPILGAISDFTASKKRFLLTFAYGGSLFTILLYFCRHGDVVQTLIIFLVAQIGFIAGNVFYDAFLPQIASEDRIDWVSGKGFSFGYLGGGLQFAIALGLVAGHARLGISQPMAARIGIAMAGCWWAGFTLFTVKYLREAPRVETLTEKYHGRTAIIAYASIGFRNLLKTIRQVGRFRHLLIFLIAFMLYNDGIQTVISMATIYGKEELKLSTTHLMLTLLVIQAIAIFGAMAFSYLAGVIGSKKALMVALVLWSIIVVYAYFITSATEYFMLGIGVGIVMGGSQALSRSLYGSMIPEAASAEFYGFYSVFSKFSAIWGPMAFAVIRQVAGSSRLSIVSLIVFFVTGLILLFFVDENRARQQIKGFHLEG